jgi:hypothetical protein
MKKIYFILVVIIILISTDMLTAQPKGRFPVLQEKIAHVKLNQVAKRMNLEKERVEELRPLYLKFEKEKHELMNERIPGELRTTSDTLTDKQAEQFLFMQTEKAKKLLMLREKYFREFNKVLSPREILQFQRIEREVNKRMMHQIRKRSKTIKP